MYAIRSYYVPLLRRLLLIELQNQEGLGRQALGKGSEEGGDLGGAGQGRKAERVGGVLQGGETVSFPDRSYNFV